MAKCEPKLISIDITPYHILDVLSDGLFYRLFLKRFKVAVEKSLTRISDIPDWVKLYGEDPDKLLSDYISNVKHDLGLDRTHGLVKLSQTPKKILSDSIGDWLAEKTGKPKSFEFITTKDTQLINIRENFENYVNTRKRRKTEKSETTSNPADFEGSLGTPPLRGEAEEGYGKDIFVNIQC